MGVNPPPKTNSPHTPNPPQFILSLSKDELGVPPKSPIAPTQSQNPPTQPLDKPQTNVLH